MSEEQEEVPEVTLEQRIEEAAKEQGWRPNGELDAFEFVKRGSQFHRDLKGQVDELKAENRKIYKIVADNITGAQKRDYDREKREHDERLRAAVETGDAEGALKLAENVPQPPLPIYNPKMAQVESWAKSQKWFNENEDMADDALAFYQVEIKKNGGIDDPDVILPKVEARIKRTYQEYFKPENPNRQQRGAGEPGGKLKTGKTGPTIDDLTEEERAHIADFVKMGMKEDKLIANVLAARRS